MMPDHSAEAKLAGHWVRTSGYAGVFAAVLYLVLVVIDVSDVVALVIGSVTGLCVSVSGLGLAKLLDAHQPTVRSHLAWLFLFVGGVMFTLIITVQLGINGYLESREVATELDREILRWVWPTSERIHFAIDITWDVFLIAAGILFSLSMLKHPRFGLLFALPGLGLSLTLTCIELWSFPATPYELGLPYIIGPLLSLWFLLVHVRSLMSVRWVREQLSHSAAAANRS